MSTEPLAVRSREELMFLLTEASQVEHMALCEYLYMAFSMKLDVSDGLTEAQAEAMNRWERTITGIAVQEMLHLTVVSNLLTAIGGCPHLGRPNFPITVRYFSPPLPIHLMPFGMSALRHFLFFERPANIHVKDIPDEMAFAYGLLPMSTESDDIVPAVPIIPTIAALYQGIQEGLRFLVNKYGESSVFVGPQRAQATSDYFGWKELIPVTNLESALAATDVVVEQGEGGHSVHRNESHFGRFAQITAEYVKLEHADRNFKPAFPVVPAFVRPFSAAPDAVLITNRGTRAVAELFDASYELLLQLLTRFFIHSHETDEMLHALADAAVDVMFGALRPLGRLMTRLPVGVDRPGFTAGPSFEVYPTSYILPHHEAAWHVMQERLTEMSHYCDQTFAHSPALDVLSSVSASLLHVRADLAQHVSVDD